MVALAPSSTTMSAVPLAASPVRPLLPRMMLFLIVTFLARMSSLPLMLWQLITVPARRIVMTPVRLPPRALSFPPGQRARRGPVFRGPGQPQRTRCDHIRVPPCLQYAGAGLAFAGPGADPVDAGGDDDGFALGLAGAEDAAAGPRDDAEAPGECDAEPAAAPVAADEWTAEESAAGAIVRAEQADASAAAHNVAAARAIPRGIRCLIKGQPIG